jgi:hypothetical protein
MTVLPYPFNIAPGSNGTVTQSLDIARNYNNEVYGRTIPLSQGKRALIGAPIWATDVNSTTEYYSTQFSSGAAGEGFTLSHRRTYTRSFAVAFGYHLAPEGDHAEAMVLRLWANGELIYDARDPSVALKNKKASGLKFRFYPGTEEQLADEAIVRDKGDEAPAFRGMMYAVFEDFVINEYDTGPYYPGVNSAGKTNYVPGQQASYRPTLQSLVDLPVIRAEIADGVETVVEPERFTDRESFTPHAANSSIMVDWHNRRAVTFAEADSGDWRIRFWDLDSKNNTNEVAITGDVDGAPYTGLSGLTSGAGFSAIGWDTQNDIMVTSAGNLANGAPIVTINMTTGAIIDQLGENNGAPPRDIDGNDPFTTGKDMVAFNHPTSGIVGYYSNGTTLIPVFCFGGSLGSIFTPFMAVVNINGGALPSGISARQRTQLADAAQSVNFIPVYDILQSATQQDAPFVYGSEDDLHLVLTKTRQGGSGGFTTEMISDTVVATVPGGGTRAISKVLVDKTGVVCISEDGSDTYATRFGFSLDAVPAVSGFQGTAPAFSSTALYDVVVPDVSPYKKNIGQYSLLDEGVFAYWSGSNFIKMNLASGETANVFSGALSVDLKNYVWDSTDESFYGYDDSPEGFYRVPIYPASTWEEQTIGDYAEWLALRAGYDQADIDVSADLDDLVIGMVLDVPWSYSLLFGNLSDLYDFAYFESEGKIKFVRYARNPVKATGALTFSGNPADNDTVTIGAQVYTFKTALTPLPFEVKIGATATATKLNLVKAINLTGVAGTDYGTGTTVNVKVVATDFSATVMNVEAIHGGAAGNTIATTDTSAVLAWANLTLTNGADAAGSAGDIITIDDMAPISEGGAGDSEVLITTLGAPSRVPDTIEVKFFDVGRDYQYLSTIVTGDTHINTKSAEGADLLQTPVVMTDSEAYRRASKLSFRATEQTITQEFRLPQAYLPLEPSDVVRVTIGAYRYIVRLDELTLNGDYSVSIGGFNFATQDEIEVQDLPEPPLSQEGVGIGDSEPVAIDGPILFASYGGQVDQFTVMTGVKSYGQSNFSVASLIARNQTENTEFGSLYNTKAHIPFGFATIALPDTDLPWQTDNDTEFTVASRSITAGMLETTIAQADFLAGQNMLIVGAPGRWEYIFFRDVEWVSTSAIKFTGLLRGRRGTEVNTGNHAAGDFVYLMSGTGEDFVSAQVEQLIDTADVGDTYEYLAFGFPQTRTPVVAEVEVEGYSLYPFAPSSFKAEPGATNSIDFSWLRRDRFATNDWVTEDVPLNEAAEEYTLEIMSGASVVRTVTGLTSPAYNYTSADQVTDGFTPPLATIKARVSQVGELGEGFKNERTLNVE